MRTSNKKFQEQLQTEMPPFKKTYFGFIHAIRDQNLCDCIRYYEEFGEESWLNPEVEVQTTPLEAACFYDRGDDFIRWLIDLGANVDFNNTTTGGALFAAMENSSVQAVRTILKYSNKRDHFNGFQNPMMFMMERLQFAVDHDDREAFDRHSETISVLMKHGFKIHAFPMS